MRKLFMLGLALLASASAHSQIWTDSVTVGAKVNASTAVPTTLRIWVPGSQPIKGVVVISGANNGWRGPRNLSGNATLRNVARQLDLAVISHNTTAPDTGMVVNFDATLGHGDSLAKALTVLAARSGVNQPGLVNAPIIAIGQGRAARFAQNLAAALPARVAGIVSWSADTIVATGINAIPHLALNGEVDGPEMRVQRGPYSAARMRVQALAARANGALIHQAVFPNASSNTLTHEVLAYMGAFLAKTVQYRIPAGANAAAGPVTLTTLAESSGWLGRTTGYDKFEPTDYTTGPFAAVTPVSNAFWLYDQQHAEAWSTLPAVTLSLGVVPAAAQVVPYCTGADATGMLGTINYPGSATLNNNVYRVQISNRYGDFDNPEYPALNIMAIRSNGRANVRDTLYMPDNLQIAPPSFAVVGVGQANRYRIRATATDGSSYTQSLNGGEIQWVQTCSPYRMLLHPVNGEQSLARGLPFFIKVSRLGNIQLSATNRIVVELSDSLGKFDAPVVVADTLHALPTIQGSFFTSTIRAVIPANTLTGIRYKLRVRATDATYSNQTSPEYIGSTNGSFLTIYDAVTSTKEQLAESSRRLSQLRVAPNPGKSDIRIVGAAFNFAQVQVTDMMGRQLLRTETAIGSEMQPLNISSLAPGAYVVTVTTNGQTRALRFLKQ